ncbi:MAG: imidazolonepropionase-like amidohydrolase [Planctomycetota bacterium]
MPLKLNVAGVPFAIAGGTARLSAMLPMMAAAAIGSGLSEEAALRAITLTPAEILGIAKDTGSLTRNKFADVIVTDGPLFASDSRVLLVLSKGRTEHKAK